MAISDALAWRLANGGTADDLYADINNFLATNPTAEQTQAAMAQYGISPQDVAAATGGASGGLLSGNIMAGASWNSTNTALQNALTQATGEQTSNYAVAGSTTTDTLNQLNKFLAGGGQFDPNATVYLQAGGVDFIQGVDKSIVKDNLNQIVKTLGDQGVNVVLTGSPYAASVQDVINNNFDPKVDPIYNEVAKANSNVALVGTQGEILQNKKLLVDALHTNAEGTAIYNQSVIDALSQFKNEVPPSTPQAIAQVQKTNTVATTPPVITQATSSPAIAQTLVAQDNTSVVDKLKSQILSQGTSTQWTGEGFGSTEANARDMAKILADTGITDISQFGTIEKTIPGYSYETEQGTVDVPDQIITTYGNKATGQEVANTYGERQGGNFFGGTYAGKGNTGYGVQFDAVGNPVFYTQGASSKDTSLIPLIQMALLASGAGGALGNALGLTGAAAQGVGTGLITGGSTALAGGSGSDILKAGLLGGGLAYGGNLIAKELGGTSPLANTNVQELNAASDLASNMADQGMSLGQINQTLQSVGYTPEAITAALEDASNIITAPKSITTTPITTYTPDSGVVNVAAQATPSLSNVINTIAATTPVNAGTVNVKSTPQQIDQAVMDLI